MALRVLKANSDQFWSSLFGQWIYQKFGVGRNLVRARVKVKTRIIRAGE